MKRFYLLFFYLLIVFSISAQIETRKEIHIPDIPGYKTLKCDFHMHTVFSDGSVWPDIRVIEAWREGLDAIAITDHIEYLPHRHDMNIDFNRPHEIAEPEARDLDITLIKGSEITRKMPPGHINAIFLTDASLLKQDDWKDAVREAKKQGAFIFWNHPGWKGHQKDGVPRWYEEHSWLLENDMLNGIEVVNYFDYYPLVHDWAIEKNITMMSNSDIHYPTGMAFEFHKGERRAITLVFAPDKSQQEIKKALFAGRTAVMFRNNLYGKEEFLEPIFQNSLEILNKNITVAPGDKLVLQIRNISDLDYILDAPEKDAPYSFGKEVTLYAGRVSIINVKFSPEVDENLKEVNLEYNVKNLFTDPETNINTTIKFPVIISK